MGQTHSKNAGSCARIRLNWWLALVALAGILAGCARDDSPSNIPAAARPTRHPTVASLVPSATDLLVEMGAADHLVAVSSFDDTSRPELLNLPRVGDYQTVDWEQIAAIRPDIMIVFQSPDRLPAGLAQKAKTLGIELVNVRPETLDNLQSETIRLGALLHEKNKAQQAVDQLRASLDAVRQRVAGAPRIRTLLVTSDQGNSVAGADTFLDDLLTIAGGVNAITERGWLEIDPERLAALNPDAAIVLLSGVSPQVQAQSARIWEARSGLAAVRAKRVYVLNKWYALQPGLHVAELAEFMADALHPVATHTTSAPSTRPLMPQDAK